MASPDGLNQTELDRRLAETKDYLLNNSKVASARSAMNMAMAAMNWFDRLHIAYVGTMEDGRFVPSDEPLFKDDLGSGVPSTEGAWNVAGNWDLFKEHWNSKEAREGRYADLRTYAPLARYMYVAAHLGKQALEYPIYPNESAGSAFAIGAKNLFFGNQHLLDRIRALANSPEAERAAATWAKPLTNISLGLAWQAFDPVLAAITRTPEFVQHLHRENVIEKLVAETKLKQSAESAKSNIWGIIRNHFEGGMLTSPREDGKINDGLIQTAHAMASAEHRDGLHQLLGASGFHKPSELSEFGITSLRSAGRDWSSRVRGIFAKNEVYAREYDKLYKEAVEKSPTLEKFYRTAKPEDILQFTALMSSGQTKGQALRAMAEGKILPFSPEVAQALREHQRLADHAWLRTAEEWNKDTGVIYRQKRIEAATSQAEAGRTIIAKNKAKIQKLVENKAVAVGELSAEDVGRMRDEQIKTLADEINKWEKLIPKLEEDARRMSAKQPAHMQFYNHRVELDVQNGRHASQYEPTMRAFLQPKEELESVKDYMRRVRSADINQVREDWLDHLAKLRGEPGELNKKGRSMILVQQLEQELADLKAAPASEFPSEWRKEYLIEQAERLIEAAKSAGNPKEAALITRVASYWASTLKAAKLYTGAQVGFAVRTMIDNTIKAGLTRPRALFSEAPVFDHLGQPLKFARGNMRQDIVDETRKLAGASSLFDTRWGKWYMERMVNPVTEYASNHIANQTGAHVYEDTYNQLAKLNPSMTPQQLVPMARDVAQRYVNDTYFFSEDRAPVIAALEMAVPGSYFYHWVRNTIFAAGQWAMHPQPTNAALKLLAAFKDGTIDHRGSVQAGDLALNPVNAPGLAHAAGLGEQVPAFHLNVKQPDEMTLSALRSADALFTGLAGGAPTLDLLQSLTNGKTPAGRDTDGMSAETARALRREINGGPFTGLNSIAMATVHKTLYDLAAGGGVMGKDAQRDSDERFSRDVRALMRAKEIEQKPITREEAESLIATANQVRGAGKLLGLDLSYNPSPMLAPLRQEIARYGTLATPDERTEFLNNHWVLTPRGPEPLLKYDDGWMVRSPGSIPFEHPERAFLEDYRNAKDPQRRLEMYREATQEQRKGIIQQGLDLGTRAIKAIGHGLSNLFETEAGAEEMPRNIITQDPNVTLTRLARKYNVPVASLLYGVPKPGANSNLSFVNTFADQEPGANFRLSPTERGELARVNADVQFAVDQSFRRARDMAIRTGSMQTYLDSFSKPFQYGTGPDGRPKTFDLTPFVGNVAKQGVESKLFRGVNAGLDNSAGPAQLHSSEGRDYEDFRAMVQARRAPKWLESAQGDILRKQRDELAPWVQKMQDAVRNYGTPGYSARALEFSWNEHRGKSGVTADGRPAFPPSDLYRRLVDNGYQNLVSKFAMATELERLQPLREMTRMTDGRGHLVLDEPFMDASFHTHLADYMLLSAVDKPIADYLERRGVPTDDASVRREATIQFHHRNDVMFGDGKKPSPITEQDVRNSNQLWDPSYTAATTRRDYVNPAPGKTLAPQSSPSEEVVGAAVVSASALPASHAPAETAEFPDLDRLTYAPNFNVALPPPNPRYLNRVSGYYLSPTAALQDVAERTAYKNQEIERIYQKQVKDLGLDAAGPPPPKQTIFSTAASALPHVDPLQMASYVGQATHMAANLGIIDHGPARDISAGLQEASLVRSAGDMAIFADNAFRVLGSGSQTMSYGERLASMSEPTLTSWSVDASGRMVQSTSPNPDYNAAYPNLGRYAAYSGQIGSLLSFGAGVNQEAGGPKEASIGMGAAGGALQGAAMGASMGGPIGAGVGAILGGTLGGFMSGMGGRSGSQQDGELAGLRKDALRQQISESQERMARSERQETVSNIRQRQNALNVGMATGRVPMQPHAPHVQAYFGYPSWRSSMGLVNRVESAISRTLQPRW